MYHIFDLIGRILISAIFIFEAIDSILFADKTKMTMAEYGITWRPDFLLYLSIVALAIGAIIGFLSGMIGIGGGIILSPVILLLHWADMKKTAAVSALFIFVNSLAGLAGLWTKGLHLEMETVWMLLIAFAGGALGSYFGAGHFENKKLKWILATVLLIASVKLMTT